MKNKKYQNLSIQQQKQYGSYFVSNNLIEEFVTPSITQFSLLDKNKQQKQISITPQAPYSNLRTQNSCLYHLKPYKFVCEDCKTIMCPQCSCLGQDIEWSHSNMHRILQIPKYIELLRQSNKNKMTIKQQQYSIIEQYEKKTKKIDWISKILSEINQKINECINFVERSRNICHQLLNKKKQSLQNTYLQKLQDKINQLQYSKTVEQIIDIQLKESESIQKFIHNWKKFQNHMAIKCQKQTSKTIKKQNVQFQILDSIKMWKQKLDFPQDNIAQILRNIYLQIKRTKQNIVKTLNLSNIQPFKYFENSLNDFKDRFSLINSSSKSKNFENKLIKSQIKNFQNRQSLKSITNEISRQIRKSEQKIHNYSPKKKINEVNQIIIYGNKEPNKLMQIYHPWKINNLINKDVFKEGLNHFDFGLVSFVDTEQNKNIIVLGGYIKNQISDCIFRIDFRRKKKQLIARLFNPLAKFGCEIQKIKQQQYIKTFKVYVCGGLGSSNKPLSNFSCLQFSSKSTLISKCQLQSLQQPRHSLSLTMHKQFLYAVGGIDSSNNNIKTVNKFSFQQFKWIQIGNICIQRSSHNSVSLKSGFYVVGGWNGQNHLKSVERLDQSKQTFHIVMQMKEPRSSFGIIGCPQSNAIIILGGKNVSQLSSCQYLSFKHRTSCYIKALKSAKSGFCCC